jgi:hypothetical protein
MPPRSMQDRLTLLEQRVSQLETATIPALREEMRAGFEDMRARFAIGEGSPAPSRRARRKP